MLPPHHPKARTTQQLWLCRIMCYVRATQTRPAVASDVKILQVDPERNLLYVRGQVPGPQGSFVLVRDAFRWKWAQRQAAELPFPTHMGATPPVAVAKRDGADPYRVSSYGLLLSFDVATRYVDNIRGAYTWSYVHWESDSRDMVVCSLSAQPAAARCWHRQPHCIAAEGCAEVACSRVPLLCCSVTCPASVHDHEGQGKELA